MSPGLIGYHPARVHELDARARRAAEHLLRTPRVNDPLAAAATATARLASSHLEHEWLPLLASIRASTAMLEFSSIATSTYGWAGRGSLPYGMTNAEALAAAEAAAAAGRVGTFAGATKTYEVVETPPSTTIPSTGHDPDAGSGDYQLIVTDRWYYEHNLGQSPAVIGALPQARLAALIAKIFGGGDDLPHDVFARGRQLEQLSAQARKAAGPMKAGRNVAVGRLTRADGEEIEFRAVSGNAPRRGFQDAPLPHERTLDWRGVREFDTELKILESASRQLKRATDDAVLEIFTELPPCGSCNGAIKQFHVRYPNVQVRVFYRQNIVAG